jgi:ferredoxin-nitrite reductase
MYKEYGFRDNRNKNRLHFLIESVGMSEFVSALKKYAKYDFSSSGQSMVTQEKITHDITKLKDASNAVHLSIASGVFSGSDLIEVASYTSNIRLTIEQSLYLIGLSDEEVLVFQNSKIYEKYSKYNNNFFINSIACAGTATCSFGLIACKPDALEMGNKLYKKFGDIGSKVRLYWSACPKGCGIHGIADIGFEGCKIKDKNGDKVDGVHIYIGGKASFEVLEARMLYKSLLLSEAYIYVEKIISYYLAYRNQNESFECFDTRVFSQLEIENILHKIG